MAVLTPQAQDFPRWYQDVLNKAELADNGPVRGTMAIRPYGYSIWERMQAEVDLRIKAAGAENLYLPLFIPQSYLQKEAEHVEGFAPELAVVTIAGGKELDEPVVVRPTSETVFGEFMAKWVQSYRDLPLLLNQWANVVRWELRPRVFLRTTEFLWQEGHTAHATQADAAAYARQIHLNVYKDFFEKVLALPVAIGFKTARERFAGAINTLACEAMMRDGKALQMATSHELGQNFARAFDVTYTSDSGTVEHCWTTSWGSSTRMVGGLIMAHGDDSGLQVPPALAPIQAVVTMVRDEGDVRSTAQQLVGQLIERGVRTRLDDRVDVGFGRRATDWELKGIPVRVEIGPRDLANGNLTVVRRDTGDKAPVAVSGALDAVVSSLDQVQRAMYSAAAERLSAATAEVDTVADALAAAANGFARMRWDALGDTGEDELAKSAVTVRCVQRADGTLPESFDEPDLYAVIARSY
jgi:prolyl-tRNA synthetase